MTRASYDYEVSVDFFANSRFSSNGVKSFSAAISRTRLVEAIQSVEDGPARQRQAGTGSHRIGG